MLHSLFSSLKSALNGRSAWQNYEMQLAFSAARVDGPVNSKEKTILLNIAKSLLSCDKVDESHPLLQQAIRSSLHPEQEAEKFAACTKHDSRCWFSVSFWLVSLLISDGPLNDKELQWLWYLQAQYDRGAVITVLRFFDFRGNANGDRSKWEGVLGVPPDAGQEFIKRMYRQKVTEYHPDKLHGVSGAVRKLAEDRLKEINEAYGHLTSPPPTDANLARMAVVDSGSMWRAYQQLEAGEVVTCAWCLQKNRLPEKQKFRVARCGGCHAYLGLYPEEADTLCRMNGTSFDPDCLA
jgi:DnaJ-domain-containing protein 1